ncbi:helix-turn-helix transcriptional regulator [Spongiactinospora sp. TRM90649]|uniref:helix-turn-helix domain-containing protein n=1 Tax=Spongiactinospora sp. TRM90649 TaxID=3031114 RepID=UPI0023F673DC|nr:helix-turn-helix transcriptional regulator [Spongiactinospora sp. TRM90649]MDF5756017.1 helix-turn-helix transcriptional regulator [Spongiactinospora sp. TRM90649]
MPADARSGIGKRISYHRRVARMTQEQLADVANIHIGTLRKIERGARGAGDNVIAAIATALGIDPSHLVADRAEAGTPIRRALPAISAAIAAYDLPEDGPVRPISDLTEAVGAVQRWRLASQYGQITCLVPGLLTELFRAMATSPGKNPNTPALVVSACRSADAVAYKFGAHDLSARLIDVMRWAAGYTSDDLLDAAIAYVRTETFFAAQAHVAGMRALETALGAV